MSTAPRVATILALGLSAACGTRSAGRDVPHVAVRLDTDPGVSGLSVDEDGTLWAVSERARFVYRVGLDGAVERHAIEGVPEGYDLESITPMTTGGFAVGTEGPAGRDDARVLRILPSGDGAYRVDETAPQRPFIAESSANRGVEGLCASGDTVIAAFELAVDKDGARLGQLVVAEAGEQQLFHVALTSETGKLADIACAFRDDRVDVLAIERHYEVSRVVSFTIPRKTAPAGPLRASVVLDLTAFAAGRNFEGIARLSDGRLAIVNDNQQREIVGPTELLLLPAPSPPP